MSYRQLVATTICVITCMLGCAKANDRFNGELSQPEAAHLDLSDDTLSRFNEETLPILLRYLAGNPRWEIREERGLTYAVRLKEVDGEFKTTLNGFYSERINRETHQTRILIAFEDEHGFGREHGNVTRAEPGPNDVPITIEGDHAGTPGNSSYLIVQGNGLTIEIYDQCPEPERTFTQSAYNEVSEELAAVLEHADSIARTGVLPVTDYYPLPLPTEETFDVEDGMQPGIYRVHAAVNTTAPGVTYLKVFDTTTGARLSEQRLTPRSSRRIGWTSEEGVFFAYQSQVTVYEGDWDHQYEARFELWLREEDGTETKLDETTRMINGWQR